MFNLFFHILDTAISDNKQLGIIKDNPTMSPMPCPCIILITPQRQNMQQ